MVPSSGDKEARYNTASSNRLRSIFDAAYRGVTPATGDTKRPPWSFGEPQPEMAALVDAGHFHGRVLDVGCGESELTLYSGAHRLDTLGVDTSETAIRRAREAAGRAAMNNVEFAVADVTDLSGIDGQFDTIVDCTLFHSLPVEHRDLYQQSIVRVASSKAVYHVLTFDRSAMTGSVLNTVSADELRDAVEPYWTIDSIRPARIHAVVDESSVDAFRRIAGPAVSQERPGRLSLPGWLLMAHLPS